MAKLLTIDEMARNVAQKALDEVYYKDKSIREWAKIILSEDAISKSEVKKILDNYFTKRYYDSAESLEEDIDNLPPVSGKEKITSWISVNEQLPKEDGDYLLYGKIDEVENDYYFIGSYDSCSEKFGWWEQQFDPSTLGCLGEEFFEYAKVYAWMPIPKFYVKEK